MTTTKRKLVMVTIWNPGKPGYDVKFVEGFQCVDGKAKIPKSWESEGVLMPDGICPMWPTYKS